VKTLVLDDKWSGTLTARVAFEVESLTLTLVARVQELGDRYAETLGSLEARLETVEAKVAAHLAEMGVR
jgi:type I restriction enzyme M protein